ncbi:MAG: DUF1800 domain-containing protein [Planctomycetes bacterium]|nr:DUF1800 domain-containing protein [Planctomycetota bacterium]
MGHALLERWKPTREDPWDLSAASHLLRRAGFGASPRTLERALADGVDATLERLCAPRGHDPALFAGIESLLASGNQELLRAWWMALLLGDGDPLGERVTLFWHDHFATSIAKVDDVRLMHRQNLALRQLGLGDFRELLHTLAKDPAMLVWLDGNENRRGQPNENFAREVLELFALGIGSYDEHDIQEAARAFTGWGADGRRFVVRKDWHDGGAKTIFGKTGEFDGDDVLELVLAHPACPRFVARRLIEEFVAVEPERAVVDALAGELVANSWSIRKTLRTLLASKLFFARDARRARIASPVELVVGTKLALELSLAPLEAANAAARMGQALFRPPSVKGWDGGRTWINAGTWLERVNSGLAVAESFANGARELSPAPRTQADAARTALERLLVDSVDPELARAVSATAQAAASPNAALGDALALVLTAPEYHLA